ncbi:MAG: hypothetical protein LBT46_15510 [Planctomycetaceae bacterium]|jgi:hypothetical protein|nr:hypothetical protein [Planctomycetaceae bacterium]
MARLNGKYSYSVLQPKWKRAGYIPDNDSGCPHCPCNYGTYFFNELGDLWVVNDRGEIAYRTVEDDEFVKTGYTTHWQYRWERSSPLCELPRRPAGFQLVDNTAQYYGNFTGFQTGENTCVLFYKSGDKYHVIYEGRYTGKIPALTGNWHEQSNRNTGSASGCGPQEQIISIGTTEAAAITGYTQPDGSVIAVAGLAKTVQEYLAKYAAADWEAEANGEEPDKSGRIDFSKPEYARKYFSGVERSVTQPVWGICWEKNGGGGCNPQKSYKKRVNCQKVLTTNTDGSGEAEDLEAWLCEQVPESCGGNYLGGSSALKCPKEEEHANCGEHEPYFINPENDYCDTEIESIPATHLLLPKGEGTLSSAYQNYGYDATPMSAAQLALTYDGKTTTSANIYADLYRDKDDYYDWKIDFGKEIEVSKMILTCNISYYISSVFCKIICSDASETEVQELPIGNGTYTLLEDKTTSSITLRLVCPPQDAYTWYELTLYEIDIYKLVKQAAVERLVPEADITTANRQLLTGGTPYAMQGGDIWTCSFPQRNIKYVSFIGTRVGQCLITVKLGTTVIGQAEVSLLGSRETIYSVVSVDEAGKTVYGTLAASQLTIEVTGEGSCTIGDLSLSEEILIDWKSEAEIGYALKKCYSYQEHICKYNLTNRGFHLFGYGDYVIVYTGYEVTAFSEGVSKWSDGLTAAVFHRKSLGSGKPVWEGLYNANDAVFCGDGSALLINGSGSSKHHRVLFVNGEVDTEYVVPASVPFFATGASGALCCGGTMQFYYQLAGTDKYQSVIMGKSGISYSQTGTYDQLFFIGASSDTFAENGEENTYTIASSNDGHSKAWYKGTALEGWDGSQAAGRYCTTGRVLAQSNLNCTSTCPEDPYYGDDYNNGYRLWFDGVLVNSCVHAVGQSGMIYDPCTFDEEDLGTYPSVADGVTPTYYGYKNITWYGYNPYLKVSGIAKQVLRTATIINSSIYSTKDEDISLVSVIPLPCYTNARTVVKIHPSEAVEVSVQSPCNGEIQEDNVQTSTLYSALSIQSFYGGAVYLVCSLSSEYKQKPFLIDLPVNPSMQGVFKNIIFSVNSGFFRYGYYQNTAINGGYALSAIYGDTYRYHYQTDAAKKTQEFVIDYTIPAYIGSKPGLFLTGDEASQWSNGCRWQNCMSYTMWHSNRKQPAAGISYYATVTLTAMHDTASDNIPAVTTFEAPVLIDASFFNFSKSVRQFCSSSDSYNVYTTINPTNGYVVERIRQDGGFELIHHSWYVPDNLTEQQYSTMVHRQSYNSLENKAGWCTKTDVGTCSDQSTFTAYTHTASLCAELQKDADGNETKACRATYHDFLGFIGCDTILDYIDITDTDAPISKTRYIDRFPPNAQCCGDNTLGGTITLTNGVVAVNGETVFTSSESNGTAVNIGCCNNGGEWWYSVVKDEETLTYSSRGNADIPQCFCDTGDGFGTSALVQYDGKLYLNSGDGGSVGKVADITSPGLTQRIDFYKGVKWTQDGGGCPAQMPEPPNGFVSSRCCGDLVLITKATFKTNDVLSWVGVEESLDNNNPGQTPEVHEEQRNLNVFDVAGNPVELKGHWEWEEMDTAGGMRPFWKWDTAVNPVTGETNSAESPGGYLHWINTIESKVYLHGEELISDPYITHIGCCYVDKDFNTANKAMGGSRNKADKAAYYWAKRSDDYQAANTMYAKDDSKCEPLEIDVNPFGLFREVSVGKFWRGLSLNHNDYGTPNPSAFSEEFLGRYQNRGVYVWNSSGHLVSQNSDKTQEDFDEYEHPATYDKDTAGKYLFFNDRLSMPPSDCMYPAARDADEEKAPLHCNPYPLETVNKDPLIQRYKGNMLLFNSGGVFYIFDQFGRTDYDIKTFKKI